MDVVVVMTPETVRRPGHIDAGGDPGQAVRDEGRSSVPESAII